MTLPIAFRIHRVCCHAMEAEIQPGETVFSLALFFIFFGMPFVFISVRQSLMKCENETVAPEHSLHQVLYHASPPAPPFEEVVLLECSTCSHNLGIRLNQPYCSRSWSSVVDCLFPNFEGVFCLVFFPPPLFEKVDAGKAQVLSWTRS